MALQRQVLLLIAALAAVLVVYNMVLLAPSSSRALTALQEQQAKELGHAKEEGARLRDQLRELQSVKTSAETLRNEREGLVSQVAMLEVALEDTRSVLRGMQSSMSRSATSSEQQELLISLQEQTVHLTDQLREASAARILAEQKAAAAAAPTCPLELGGREDGAEPIPILLVCYNRPEYLRITIQNLLERRPSASEFPIIVSEDGTDASVWSVIAGEFGDSVVAIQNYNRGRLPTAYHHIASHYKFAIASVLEKMQFSSVIILEDDMKVSPDFFSYFRRMRDILKEDGHETLLTASAWNDNGLTGLVEDPTALRRSDFFGGLGWMVTADLWSEMGPKWPKGYWDDWMREPEQRKGRHVIHPEISRTYTFGEEGSSKGQFWQSHLQHVQLHEDPPIDFSTLDLGYLQQDAWDERLGNMLRRAQVVTTQEEVAHLLPGQDAVLTYSNWSEFQRLARKFRLMDDEKAGVPRTGYKDVVYFNHDGHKVFLAPGNYKEVFHL